MNELTINFFNGLKNILTWSVGLNVIPILVLFKEQALFTSLWYAYLLGWIVQVVIAIAVVVVGTILHFVYKIWVLRH